MEGTVKFFNRRKGFGFVSGDDEKDYFVHFTALAQGTFLRDNDRVSFEPVEGEKGLKAEQVSLLEKASERSDLPAEEAPATEKEAPVEEQPAKEAPATEEEAPVKEEPVEEAPEAEKEAPVEEEKQE